MRRILVFVLSGTLGVVAGRQFVIPESHALSCVDLQSSQLELIDVSAAEDAEFWEREFGAGEDEPYDKPVLTGVNIQGRNGFFNTERKGDL